ncbi:LysM peptidoglycan-binding domain-containing protein [Emticicia sp. SJ17W-69]|uniref:LysM peptidoglycan-binding domain-containing protein n=1 Tax=Emticicia sp. SJ17W-69 TaxID=3421657 RepID=UPI003EB7FDD7
MKQKIIFLLLLVSIQGVFAQKALLPEVSKKLEFAGISIKLDADAQKLVQKEVNTLLTPENKYLLDKLQRIQWYFPIIETILEEEQVPEDFKYVAVSESSLLPDAVSSSNAVGYWQMKPTTAQEVGLRVDKDVDERKNIFASTRAAAIYLKRNNLIYKNWVSTLFSYSLGATGVSKIVPAEWSNATEITFDAKTDRYLIKALANRVAFEYRINRLKESPFSFVEYKKSKGKTLEEIASATTMDVNELRKYNSWLQADVIPTDKDYSVAILVPAENLEDIQGKLNHDLRVTKNNASFPILKRVTNVAASEEEPIFYEINGKKGILAKPGDDVASLARNGKMKIPDFLRYNDMNEKDLVEEGKVYYLQKKSRKGAVPQHVVLTGQTIWEISQIYGIRLKNLLRLNRMKTSQRIQKGRLVYLQKKSPKNQPIEVLNGKDNEEVEKVPIKENYDGNEEKVLANDNKKTEAEKVKTPNSSSKTNKPTETVLAEESNKKADKPRRDEDDIIVITDEPVEVKKTPAKVSDPDTPTVIVKTTPTKPAPVSNANEHIVDVGQTLYSIARQYNVSVKDLAAWNNIPTDEKVKIGQVLIVKSTAKAAVPNKVEATKPTLSPSASSFHVVQKTETLYSISKRYGVSMKQIQDWNGMSDQNVKIGQKLVIKK